MLAREQGWYEADDRIDAALPFLNRDLGWDDRAWGATEHGFQLLLDRYVRPGDRVLEVGAAKSWASQHLVPLGCEYVACDLVVDPLIGLGRGRFFEQRVGPYLRVQADGERLPFADGDASTSPSASRRSTTRSTCGAMVGELARVTRRGGIVAALNEGTRAPYRSGANPEQEHEKELGINEHVHTMWAYLWAFARAGPAAAAARVRRGPGRAAAAQDRRQAPAPRRAAVDAVGAQRVPVRRAEPVRAAAVASRELKNAANEPATAVTTKSAQISADVDDATGGRERVLELRRDGQQLHRREEERVAERVDLRPVRSARTSRSAACRRGRR